VTGVKGGRWAKTGVAVIIGKPAVTDNHACDKSVVLLDGKTGVRRCQG